MSERSEARHGIADILGRGEGDRPVDLWYSDIMRMTDMLLWLYTDFAKPMVYDKGNSIELSCKAGDSIISDIEKSDGYPVTISGAKVRLCDIKDIDTLRAILRRLVFKESCDWDYYCDMVPEDLR